MIITVCIEGFKQFALAETGMNYNPKVELENETNLSKHSKSVTVLNTHITTSNKYLLNDKNFIKH